MADQSESRERGDVDLDHHTGVRRVERTAERWLFGHRIPVLILFALVVALGMALEARLGQRQPQGWEFYAVTGTLFLTLAFPGFVWRYLLKHRK